ncbi:Molybdate-anion transporter [Chytridiales sp. JEL 0842]|nr:Molybdate-anion transporter [Chytridiales sp. JEL 0842]
MDFFFYAFVGLSGACAALSYTHRGNLDMANANDSDAETTKEKLLNDEDGTLPSKVHVVNTNADAFELFRKNYLVVYSLVMFSDWLQGSYLYPLYKSYGYDLSDIAILFVVGFLSSAVFGTVIGSVADKLGRKVMCLAFCVIYIVSCWTKFSSDFRILLLGRVTGGIGTSLLFSVFEAWMVSAHQHKGFKDSLLSDIFAWSTFLNGIVAILSGLVANFLVDNFGLVSPFFVAIGILALSMFIISGTWVENYGSRDSSSQTSFNQAFMLLRNNPQVLEVGLMQVLFESPMYAFVFLWSPTLEGLTSMSLPFGLIFSAFMVSIAIGSVFFKMAMKANWSHEKIAVATFSLASIAIFIPYLFKNLYFVYASFCLFEVCCGVFFPVMGSLRGKYIPDATRATVMNVFRLPLNIIVVAILYKVNGGDDNGSLYLLCSVLVLIGLWFSLNLFSSSKLVRKADGSLSSGSD